MNIKERVAAVQDSLQLPASYCSGTLTIPSGISSYLYYDIDMETARHVCHLQSVCQLLTHSPRKIDLANATPDDLEKFANACFEVNSTAFSTLFSAERAGLVDIIRSELLEYEDDGREIRLEVGRPNIYGASPFHSFNFFECALIHACECRQGLVLQTAQKDTPRGEEMFGSLVIVFPTTHDGGEFLLREDDNEWTLDFANMLSQPSESSDPRIAYVAFYSDVEHEVKIVKAGYRVTLTHGICSTGEQSPVPLTSSTHPKGGYIGFGLRHQYSVSDEMVLASLKTSLKGSDATLARTLTWLSLEWRLCVLYRKVALTTINFLSTSIVDLVSYGDVDDSMIYDAMGEDAESIKFVDMTGTPIKKPTPYDYEDKQAKPMFKVTETLKEFRITSQHLAYGNEPKLAHLYGDLCLVAEIPAKEA
ncbi:hypothetical protein BU15DRAFT_74761 [Melanogaster broomeanus]|nr:hypothetical protein BU15DRAFT_74761 [Melanogaster broomeanus]